MSSTRRVSTASNKAAMDDVPVRNPPASTSEFCSTSQDALVLDRVRQRSALSAVSPSHLAGELRPLRHPWPFGCLHRSA